MSSLASDDTASTMRDIVQRKFLEDVIGSVSNKSLGWMILVLDETATRVISSALTMYDIMEKKITIVEQLKKPRQPFPEMDVIYLVTPSQDSIERITKDFITTKPKYGNVHIFFLTEVCASFRLERLCLYDYPHAHCVFIGTR
jgi:hypothetical protein